MRGAAMRNLTLWYFAVIAYILISATLPEDREGVR